MMKVILETERLVLREFDHHDAEAVFALHSDPQVQRYTGEDEVTSIEHVRDGIENIWKHEYQKHGFARWATIHKEDDKLIGWAGLKYLPEFDEVDLGYRFIPEYWGQGIATEISIAIVKYGFQTLNLERIIGISMLENPASIKVLEKAGLTFDKYAPYEPDDDQDAAWYSLNREDYLQTISSALK